ncbi:hypothetical protein D1871_04625 [Nakamurella silvestris]|nr:hypothetical protein D1871_04625 [Nakamurella silvestris]
MTVTSFSLADGSTPTGTDQFWSTLGWVVLILAISSVAYLTWRRFINFALPIRVGMSVASAVVALCVWTVVTELGVVAWILQA